MGKKVIQNGRIFLPDKEKNNIKYSNSIIFIDEKEESYENIYEIILHTFFYREMTITDIFLEEKLSSPQFLLEAINSILYF